MRCLIRRFVIVSAFALSAAGCTSHRESVEQRDDAARAEYPGKRFESVTAKLGGPVFVDEFPAGDAGDEFRGPLWQVFPPNDPKARQRIIREAWWPSEDDFLVVWFAETGGVWIAVEAAIMDTSVEY